MVVYAGTAEDKAIIKQYEFNYSAAQREGQGRGASYAFLRQPLRFNCLLTSYENLLREAGMFNK